MIYTSIELFNAFTEDTRQIVVRVKINGAVFDNDNISTLNLEYGSMDGANLSLGSTFASSLKITFAELVEGLVELDEIEVEMGAVLPNGTIEYVPMGTFIINEEVMMDRNNNTTSIDALDRMVMLGNIYESTLPGESARIIDIAVDIANQAGVVVSNDFDRLRTDSIQIPRDKTLREAIGIIAQFEVGFATFNRDGKLAIRRLNDTDFDISPEDYTLKGLVKNEVPFRLNGVQCQIGDSENDTLQAGASTGNQIILNNPSMTQEHLDRIYTELNTLNYYPFTLDWYGHPALEAGDWIEIEDLQGNKFKTPNLHYTLDFNGGLKAKSQAETTSSSEVVYQYKSPLKQEIHAIAARLSASGGNHVYDDLTEPENPKEGDLWFKPEGPDTLILKYTRLEDGTLDWVEELNTGDTTKNADAIAEQQQEIEDARQVADEAVDSINTAVANAGFTSLDDTLQNMNYITMNAEQSAQQAITNASNAYGLAQTSISEAQTAQANSLTALGKADNALDGVSSLNVRVDDVEAELSLKADNAFMNEDGTLTTLSNAITFNAHRFSGDMSRIESRVESLAGEINLVILRDAFEDRRIEANTVYPNVSFVDIGHNTMRELITVTGGEKIALSKEATTPITNDTNWRVIFYDGQMGIISRPMTASNEIVLTVPNNATKMWVSWPKGSKPQIIRGSDFLPYRPNMADQMTTDEMVIFRNEYDEYADRTERRLSAIDSTGGRLEVAEYLLTQTANGLQTTVGKVDSQGSRLSTVEQTANGLQSEVYNSDGTSKITQLATGVQSLVTNLSELEVGGRNLIKNSDYKNGLPEREMYNANVSVLERFDPYGGISPVIRLVPSSDNHYFRFQRVIPRNEATYTFSAWMRRTNGTDYGVSVRIGTERGTETVVVGDTWKKVKVTGKATRGTDTYHFVEIDTNNQWVTIDIFEPMFEFGTMASTHQVAPEDTQSQISQLANNINLRVTKGDVLSQINIEAGRTLIQSDKLLLNANNTVITGTTWMDGAVIANASIDGAKIQDATIGSAKIASLDVSKISGNTASFVTAGFNGVSSWMQLDSDGIHMSGSGSWRRTYITPTGFDLYNGEGGSNKAGAIGYFKPSGSEATYAENVMGNSVGAKHMLGIGANASHDIVLGYNDGATTNRFFKKALQVDGETGRIRVYRPISPSASNYNVSLIAYNATPYYGVSIQNDTSGVMFAENGTHIWDYGASAWDHYNMTTRQRIGFYGDSGIQVLTANKNMEIWAGGSSVDFYTSNSSHRFRISDGGIAAYANLNMNNYQIINQSDSRLKTNVTKTNDDSLEKITNIEFVDFNWLSSGEDDFGIIAQQVQRVAPELIAEGEDGYLGINNTRLNMMTVHAVKELALRELNTNKIASQALQSTETNEEKIHQLQKELSKANRRIEELESVM